MELLVLKISYYSLYFHFKSFKNLEFRKKQNKKRLNQSLSIPTIQSR